MPPIKEAEMIAALPARTAKAPPEFRPRARKMVVLDDDPTGTQTVHDVPVITRWEPEILRKYLASPHPLFYILTNSRSLETAAAVRLNQEIAVNLCAIAERDGFDFDLVSRSDSTLRGHYPDEIQALRETLERQRGFTFNGEILIPAFFEGGRLTAYDVHWVREGDSLVPAGETEYARDKAFGYKNSDLKLWIAEKTGGRVTPADVLSITIEDLRRGGPAAVAGKLRAMNGYRPVIVNAVDYGDLAVFCSGAAQVEAEGRRFLYRTAASFVKAASGQSEKPLLVRADLEEVEPAGGKATPGGLIVVGSHIKKSGAQLDCLLAGSRVTALELSVAHALDKGAWPSELERISARMNEALAGGRDAVVYTSRELVAAPTGEGNLAISRMVSRALVEIVRGLLARPDFIVAKGGITSSDVATEGLSIGEATVLGQILPGVPVWRAGPGSRFPGMPYVIFPGNVGDEGALRKVYEILRPL